MHKSRGEEIEKRSPRWALQALFGYALVAVCVFHPLLPKLSTHIISNDQFTGVGRDDGFAFVWMYWWVQKALSMGHSLVACDWIFPPDGENLALFGLPYLPILLTYPVGRIYGAIVGNNVMVLSMIALGAFAYFCMLRRLLNLSFFSAFVAGALFGFCPWFIWKAGGHYNMIGSCFWGVALGAVLAAYAKNEFTAKNSALWAVFVWATFWSSLIEFFMLGIVVAMTVAVFEIQRAFLRDHAIAKRVWFFLPSALGAVSLSLFLFARKGQTVALPLMQGPTLLDLIPSAKLSFWSYIGLPNRTATVIPHSYGYLALIGGFALWKRRSRVLWPIVALFIGAIVLVIDPFHIPSTVLRALPTGKGFRFFERFIPFALYFLLILSAVGLDFLYKEWVPKKPAWLLGAVRIPKKAVVIGGILVFAASEIYPVLLNVTPIMKLPITPEVRAELRPDRYCLVVPDGDYRHVLQTYQVELDIPCVNIAYWDRMDISALQRRAQEYPGVYAGAPAPHPQPTAPNVEAPAFADEARALKIGYLLFENKNAAGTWRARGRTLLETDRELLIALK